MPDSKLPETLAWYRDSVKWTIGLSAAALLGAASAVDKVQKGPLFFQLIFAGFILASTASLFCAGVYYFALTNYGNTYERAQGLWKRVAERGEFSPSALENDATLGAVPQHEALQDVSRTYREDIARYRRWHKWTEWTLVAIILLVAAVLIAAGFASNPPTPDKPPLPHYSIAISGSHRGNDGKMHVHTFLLSENTGEVWQMVCKEPDRVEFVRVHVEGVAIPEMSPPTPLR